MDRHEVADQRHGDREHAAGNEACENPHRDQQAKTVRHRADQGRHRDHEHADIHQPGFAEEIADDAERRLHQRVWERECGRQQRRGLHIDPQIGGDFRDHRIDRAGEQRLGEYHQSDDFQNVRNGQPPAPVV
jgi:hypothetical protein